MRKFRAVGMDDNKFYKVEHKVLWFWVSSYVHTDFFSIWYESLEEANEAIRKYNEERVVYYNDEKHV